jgi:hemoglobin
MYWKELSVLCLYFMQGIEKIIFTAVAGHLVATLEELNVPKPLIDEVVAVVLTTKDDILNV